MNKRQLRENARLLSGVAEEYGLAVEMIRGRRHPRFKLINLETGEHRSVTMPCTPSDWRAMKNQRAITRRLAQEIAK